MKIYYAKSKMPDETQPTNREHLQRVSDLAEKFGQPIDMGDMAKLAGLFHDFGKYTDYFQDILLGKRQTGDHAIGGAIALKDRAKKYVSFQTLCEVIAGHHGGLKGYDEIKDYLEHWEEDVNGVTSFGKFNTMGTCSEFMSAFKAFQSDFPTFRFPKTNFPPSTATMKICVQEMSPLTQGSELKLRSVPVRRTECGAVF